MGLEDFNIQSGDDYANLLINDLRVMVEQEGMEEDLFKVWEKHIRELCNLRYYQYISGDIDTFMLSDKEMMKTYQDSTLEWTGEILAGLVEKGEVSMSVRDDGEILYGIPKDTVEDWRENGPPKSKKNRRKKK